MTRWVAIAALLMAAPATARTSLGTFDGWGAFRDDRPLRCFAIAEPERVANGGWRPFASVATWPDRGVRGQLHVRLARAASAGRSISLVIGSRRFALVGGGSDGWAPDARADAAIVAAMRSAPSMTVTTTTGSYTYALKGAATALDAASLGCARR